MIVILFNLYPPSDLKLIYPGAAAPQLFSRRVFQLFFFFLISEAQVLCLVLSRELVGTVCSCSAHDKRASGQKCCLVHRVHFTNGSSSDVSRHTGRLKDKEIQTVSVQVLNSFNTWSSTLQAKEYFILNFS